MSWLIHAIIAGLIFLFLFIIFFAPLDECAYCHRDIWRFRATTQHPYEPKVYHKECYRRMLLEEYEKYRSKKHDPCRRVRS